MTEYTKILEQIKVSEERVATVSKDIKDIEAEIKTLDGEIEIMKAKEKQLNEEISYKKKMVNDKEWELQSIKRRHKIWTTMLEEKRNLFEKRNEELEMMQQKVWDTRIKFYDETMEFLTENNFLLNNDIVERVIRKYREKKKLLESVNNLESSLSEIENKHSELKGRYDLLKHLEKEKETLMEYEQSADIIRLQTNIDSYTKELETLELELSKYSERATMNNHEVVLQKLQQPSKDGESTMLQGKFLELKKNTFEVHEENPEYQKKKQPFKPKVPSFLLKKHSKKDDM